MLFETKWYGKPLFVQVKNMVKQGEPHHVLCQTLERERERERDRQTDRQTDRQRQPCQTSNLEHFAKIGNG